MFWYTDQKFVLRELRPGGSKSKSKSKNSPHPHVLCMFSSIPRGIPHPAQEPAGKSHKIHCIPTFLNSVVHLTEDTVSCPAFCRWP